VLTVVQRGGATREKPPEVVRGYASRLPWVWDGLCFAVPFNDSTRDAARDLVANAAPSGTSGLVWTRDNRGNPAALLDASSYVDYPDNPAHNKPSTQITVYVRLRRAGTSDPSGGIFGKKLAAGTASFQYLSWALYESDSLANALQGEVSVGATSLIIQSDSVYVTNTTDWVSVFLRWRTGQALRLDVLGERGEVLGTAIDDVTASGTILYDAGTPIRFNTSDLATQNFYGAYSQGMVWSRVLTDVELRALVADPYGWYSPRRETIGVSSPYPLFGGQSFMREVPSG
jgi:hypothetical protein